MYPVGVVKVTDLPPFWASPINIRHPDAVVVSEEKEGDAVKPLEGMDWLHLAVADLYGCDILLTTDNGFRYLQKVSKFLKLDNVKKVVILSSDGKLDVVKEVSVE